MILASPDCICHEHTFPGCFPHDRHRPTAIVTSHYLLKSWKILSYWYTTQKSCVILTNNLSFLVLCPFILSTFHSILLCRLALNMWSSAWMLGWQVWPLWLAIYFLFYSNYFWLLSKYLKSPKVSLVEDVLIFFFYSEFTALIFATF